MKKQIILKDSEYFQDNEEIIKLESCVNGGQVCRMQMKQMNKNLLLSQKFVERKEFNRAFESIKIAYYSTFDLKEERCQKCAGLFRDTILNSLNTVVDDLRKMTKGLFGSRNFKPVLQMGEQLLEELKENQ